MLITIIGAGNAGTQLALALHAAGHSIVQVLSRSEANAKALAEKVSANFTTNIAALDASADIFLLTVRDDSIEEVAKQLSLRGKIVAHTSGTQPKRLLESASHHHGIFYPMQTMKKEITAQFAQALFLIEGSDDTTARTLQDLAQSISQNVHIVDETQRQWIHVGAVFCNNFTNHLFALTENFLGQQKLPFDLMKPLIFNFLTALETHSPAQLQTGPAARGETPVIEKHLALLIDEPRLKKVYEVLTESILASRPT